VSTHTPVRTALDKVNPVTRLGAAIILTFPLFVTLDWVSATVVVVLEVAIWLSLAPRSAISRLRTLGFRSLPFLIAAPLAGLSLALYGKPGGQIFYSWGFIVISEQSLSYAAAVSARVLAFGMACLVTLISVDPTDMADGLAQVWHLPARPVLAILAATRLIGRLSQDWRTMTLARRARGLGDGGRIRRYATIVFALLVSAIRRGSTLATSMEVRGFGRRKRTWARESTVGLADVICLVVACAIVGVGIGISVATGQFRWIGSVL
jgi:energy-coupling factor transport system permease protein